MKNIIKNKNGYMLVEIIVASAIALVMAYFLIDITIKLTNKNNDYYIDSVLLTDKNIITKEIMDDINSKKLVSVIVDEDHTKATLTYDDGVTKDIIINKANKTIKYGDYTKKLSDEINLEEITLENDNNILVINLPIYTNYSKEDYGIKLTLPYSADIEIVYPKMADLIIDNMPVATGSYKVDTSSCSEVSMTYDYSKKGFKVSNIFVSSSAKCSPKITKTTRTTLVEYLKNKVGSDGIYKITEHGEEDYRYRGMYPNNYIKFNDEIWRIIGVFDENSHGVTGTHLVKIIRNNHIGPYTWDAGPDGYNGASSDKGKNDFTKSDIYKILTAYYNHQDATGEDYCVMTYYGRTEKTKCDFSTIGIQEAYQKMVNQDINWFLGGTTSHNVNRKNMYLYERGDSTASGNPKSTKEAGVVVPVGLMYPTDFSYASLGTYQGQNTINTGMEAELNWLNLNVDEHTITQDSSNGTEVIYLDRYGRIMSECMVAISSLLRPVLYLNSNVTYISGTGTYTDPYIVSID